MNLKKFTLMIAVLMYSIKIFSQCSSTPVYCNPTFTNINTFNIGLQNVTFGSTINNSTTALGTAPNFLILQIYLFRPRQVEQLIFQLLMEAETQPKQEFLLTGT